MAPKFYRESYVAGRSFYKKNFKVWWLQQGYIPLSHDRLFAFVDLVEKFFDTKYQFPMLVTMLSMLLDEIDPTDVIDWMPSLKGQSTLFLRKGFCSVADFMCVDRPMMLVQSQCFKGKNRRALKDIESFELLLEQCAKALGIPCQTFEDWHETRFKNAETVAFESPLPSPTCGLVKNFEFKTKLNMKLQLDRKDKIAEKGLVVATATKLLPRAGKRRAESESPGATCKKHELKQFNEADGEAFIQRLIGGMRRFD